MKQFVRIQQTFTLEAIMDVKKGETEEQLAARVKEYCDANGGPERIIVCGGKITAQATGEKPNKEDYDDYEVID